MTENINIQKKKPNILWICTDQQRYDTLGCTGNEFVKTPNIDRLAEMGVLFERGYCQNPVCAPSRASFLTGRYPRTCRLRQNGQNMPADEKLVTKLLADEGYACGLSGKLHLAVCHPSVCKVMEERIDDGYVEFHWSHHPEKSGKGNWVMNEYTRWLNEQGTDFSTTPYKGSKYVNAGMPEKLHQSTWCTDKAIDFIKAGATYKVPWLFSLNLYDPHHPFDPPVEYLERYMDKLEKIPLPNYVEGELDTKSIFQKKDHEGAYDTKGNFPFTEMDDNDHRMLKAAYWAMCDLIDVQVGRLLDTLEQTGQLDNTVIIYTSDHGESLGDHGIYLKGPYFYETGIHVPLIISWPAEVKGGRRSTAMVELVDLAPTLMEAAGLPIYEGMQGKSLLSLLKGTTPLDDHRNDVYCEYYNSNVNHTDPRAHATMIFDGRYKVIRIHGFNEGEIYDLEKDPNETVNQWNNPEYREIKTEMLARLCDRMAWTCDPLPHRWAFW